MKKIILLSITIVSLLCASCEVHTSNNGKLDGYWHLVAIDTLSTGGQLNLSDSLTFWSIQGKLIQMKNITTKQGIMFQFHHTSDTLKLYDARHNNRVLGDPPAENLSFLIPFGINKMEEDVLIEHLGSSHMILRSDILRLKFTRF